MLTVTMWEARARDVLPTIGATPAPAQPLSWNEDEGQQLAFAHGLRPILPHLRPRPTDPWPRFSAQGAQFTPQVIWTDVRAIVGPASRLTRQLIERLHAY